MRLKQLIGAGDRITLFTLPFAVAGVVANLAWPSVFTMHLGTAGVRAGIVLLVIGVPLWLGSALQVLIYVPRGRLITTGGFALVRHPLYCAVSLFVLPGCGLVLDTWAGFAVGAAMYVGARLFAGSEERDLTAMFGEAYQTYRANVWLPWL